MKMEGSSNGTLISEGCFVLFQKGSMTRCFKVQTAKPQKVGKKNDLQVHLGGAVGEPFGTVFKLVSVDGVWNTYTLQKIGWEELREDSLQQDNDRSGVDNRHLNDDNTNQKLTREEIMEMKSSGVSGEEVVQAIAANSSTFSSKTKYSQSKYIKKKAKKYAEPVTLHKPSLDLVADMYFSEGPMKISNLRQDTLFQLLSYSNVAPGGRCAVYDAGTLNLVCAGLLQRLGRGGRLVNVFAGNRDKKCTALTIMDYDDRHMAVMSYIDINRLHKVTPPGKPDENELPLVIEDDFSERINGTTDNGIADKETPDNGTADKGTADKGTADNGTADNGTSDKGTSDNGTAEKGITDVSQDSEDSKKRKLDGDDSKDVKIQNQQQHQRKRQQNESVSKSVLEAGVFSLVVASREHPTVPVMALMPYLLPGCPFVVFCPYKEPLMDLYLELKNSCGTNLRMSETWMREYQVLPERTHPHVNMSGGGGYLLCGTKIRTGDQF